MPASTSRRATKRRAQLPSTRILGNALRDARWQYGKAIRERIIALLTPA